MFLMFYSANWPNFIVIVFTSPDIEQYMYYNYLLTRRCCWDVIKCEINLIKLFFYMTKKSRQKIKYLENENSFRGDEIISIFLSS